MYKILFALIFILINLKASEIINRSISITSIDTKSHEYVYKSSDNNYKLSELIWEAEDVSLLGLEFDYSLSSSTLLNFSYKINIFNSDSMMNDYDWVKDDPNNWSDWSNHPNTQLEHLSILDINIKKLLESKNTLNAYFTVGYKIESKKFKAYDGTYVYSSSSGFRDETGYFNGLGITYEETFSSLYLGLGGSKKYKKLNFKAALKYSPFVVAKNIDTHHFRYFTNENSFDPTTMTQINLVVEYPYTKDLLFVITYENVEYEETKGTTTRTYYGQTSDTYTSGGTIPQGSVFNYSGAGISNSYNSFNIGIIKKF